MKDKTLLAIFCLLITGCALVTSQAADDVDLIEPTTQPTMSTLPNPASSYCQQQGYQAEIRTAADGSQAGFCFFPDGSECDEWAYYRGECSPASQAGSMNNPASAYCENQGYTVELRPADDGSQAGFCLFPDGSQCDEWAYFRGECLPGSTTASDNPQTDEPAQWEIYTNQALGYTFQYPQGAQVSTNDDPLKSLYVSGSTMSGETWTISHPSDRADYRPAEGADLAQWLVDHYLACESSLPDLQIAGTTAIHCRHERSPQSYAADIYYLASRGQLYQIIIGHTSDVEDWPLDERFLQSFTFIQPAADVSPFPLPAAVSIDPAAYRDWITYTHPVYNFSLRLPNDWIVEEVTGGGPGMDGHLLSLHPADQYNQESIRLTFRLPGEDVLLWPTGVGQGDFIPLGTLAIDGEPAQRMLLVCPTGEVTAIWYLQSADQPDLVRGGLEFGIIYNASAVHCQAEYSLGSQKQLVSEMMIASLHVP
jgi:putative hemolysin